MKFLVQKYGGTSVGSPEKIGLVAQRIKETLAEGNSKIAVVVSAMSGETNRLVALMNEVNPDAHPRFADMVTAAGEQVTCGLLSAALQKIGVNARPFLAFQLGIKTDPSHQKARIESIDCKKLHEAWQTNDVAVVAGFQGVDDAGQITTLGRGGSDTSAVALAVAVGAEYCEINTDVDGFFTTDPRITSKARLIDRMDYESSLEMASLGSKVLHTRCVEVAAKYKLPIIVRNTFKGKENKGTMILEFNNQQKLESPVVSGVSKVDDVAKVTLNELNDDAKTVSILFEEIAKDGINVDIIVHDRHLINNKPVSNIGFTVNHSEVPKVNALLGNKSFSASYVIEENYSKVSVVGLGMRSNHGVAAKTFSTLSDHGVDIHMVSTSEIKISCLVDASEANRAVKLLHEGFCE